MNYEEIIRSMAHYHRPQYSEQRANGHPPNGMLAWWASVSISARLHWPDFPEAQNLIADKPAESSGFSPSLEAHGEVRVFIWAMSEALFIESIDSVIGKLWGTSIPNYMTLVHRDNF